MAQTLPFPPGQMAAVEFLNRFGMRLIADSTISGVTAVSFTSIPQTYKHLLVVLRARTATAVTGEAFNVRINGVTAASYHGQYINGLGTSQSAGESLSATMVQVASVAAASAPAGMTGSALVLFPNYTASSSFPGYIAVGGTFIGTTTGTGRAQVFGGILASAAAITRLDFLDATSTQITGKFDLYGMP